MFQNNLWILSFLLKINTPARLTIEPPNGLRSAVFIPVETPVGDDSLAKEVILVDNDITDKDEHIVNKVDNLKERLSLSAKPNDWDQCEGVRQVAPAVRESIWNTVSVWRTWLHLDRAILNMVYFCQISTAVETCSVLMTKIAVARDF